MAAPVVSWLTHRSIACREATALISQGLDAHLGWRQRLALRLHLLICRWCRRYLVQVHLLRQALRSQAGDPARLAASGMPPEARRRLGAALEGRL